MKITVNVAAGVNTNETVNKAEIVNVTAAGYVNLSVADIV